MKKTEFFAEAIKNLKTVGTFTSSSKTLIRNTIKPIDFSKDIVVVELGAGDGCFTELVLERMTPDSKIIAFELNAAFAETMRKKINDDRVIIIEDSAEHITDVLNDHAIEEVDHFISALPLVVLPDGLTQVILKAVKKHLKKTGYYCQISYSTVKKKMLENFFDTVKMKYTIKNLPPAFSYYCKFYS